MSTEEATSRELAGKFIEFLETQTPPERLFTPDVFCDFTSPQWRQQAQGIEDSVGIRKAGHPGPSRVPRSRFDATATGFVLEVEEEWDQDATFMNRLADEGLVLFAGPLAGSGQGRIRVLLVAAAHSEAEIRRRLADDPWATSQLLETASVEPWEPVVGGDRLATASALR
jgi:uncharacterized protein YciI